MDALAALELKLDYIYFMMMDRHIQNPKRKDTYERSFDSLVDF